MSEEKYNILEDPEQPTIGMEMQGRKHAFDFFGPKYIVCKIQALEFVDGKMWRRPENTEFPNGFMPDKEGCDNLIMHSHSSRPGVNWLCWVNLKPFDVDKFFNELYAETSSAKQCEKIYELSDIGENYKTWEEVFERVDTQKIEPSPLITFCVVAKSKRKYIKNFNSFIDKAIEVCKKKNENSEKTSNSLEEAFNKWRYKESETDDKNNDIPNLF
jgi:hypothetical protein